MIKGLSLDGVRIRYTGRNPDNGKARSRRAERVCQSGRVLQAHLRHVPVLEPRVHVPDIQSEFTADWRDRHTPLPFRAKTGIPSDGFRAGKSLRPVPVGIEGVQHLPVPVTGGRVVAVLQRIVLGASSPRGSAACPYSPLSSESSVMAIGSGKRSDCRAYSNKGSRSRPSLWHAMAHRRGKSNLDNPERCNRYLRDHGSKLGRLAKDLRSNAPVRTMAVAGRVFSSLTGRHDRCPPSG